MRFKHTDAGKISVAFREVQSVPDYELIWNGEPDEIGFQLHIAPPFFLEKDAGPDGCGFPLFDFVHDHGERFSRVENVVDKEDVAVLNIEQQIVQDLWNGNRTIAVSVARNADAIEAERSADFSQQIGREKDRTVHDRDDGDFVPPVTFVDLRTQLRQPALDRRL